MKQWIILSILIIQGLAAHNILQYGATHGVDSTDVAFQNADAFLKAVQAANSTEDREVLIPHGYTFTFMPTYLNFLNNITFTVDGTVYLSEDFRRWPAGDFWSFEDCNDLHFQGQGKIDGRGFNWWWRELLVQNLNKRPHMINIRRVRNVIFESITLMNSPHYHINAMDIDSFQFLNFEIYVDVWAQKKLLSGFGHFDHALGIPTFPLNTDGIDPSGTNIVIRNVTITNFDDAVAVKPAHSGGKVATCAQNILVQNCTVTYGLGMTIGTVPPNKQYNCIKDVIFRDIIMKYPIKAIYVKTNPGTIGYGIISNITFENFDIHKPLWWGIYIGPQQQKQPDGSGPGCMLYPIDPKCDTEPRITIEYITLRNIRVEGSWLTPGIIRCDPQNPCKNFIFDNVYHNAWYKKVGLGFITENVFGESHNSFPDPGFKREIKN